MPKGNEYEALLFIYWNCQGEKDDMKAFLIPPKKFKLAEPICFQNCLKSVKINGTISPFMMPNNRRSYVLCCRFRMFAMSFTISLWKGASRAFMEGFQDFIYIGRGSLPLSRNKSSQNTGIA